MEYMPDDWPWVTPFEQYTHAVQLPDAQQEQHSPADTALSSALLHDLALPLPFASSSSRNCDVDRPLPSFDEDMFSCLDDFILYPDGHSEELRLFDNAPLQRSEATEATAYLSPVSSITESLPSPATSYVSSIGAATPQDQYNDNEDVESHKGRRRRRRNSTVFPCTLCDRICYTSVEARRHHARHIKPFKCPEPPIVPLHSQPMHHLPGSSSSPQSPSQPSERPTCEKAFATKNELERHRKSVHYCIPEVGPKEWFKCPIDGCKIAERLWPRRDNLLVHMKQAHPQSAGMDLRVYVPQRSGILVH